MGPVTGNWSSMLLRVNSLWQLVPGPVSHVIFGHDLEVKVDESLAVVMQAVLSMFALQLENSPWALLSAQLWLLCLQWAVLSWERCPDLRERIFCDLMTCCLPSEVGLMHKVTHMGLGDPKGPFVSPFSWLLQVCQVLEFWWLLFRIGRCWGTAVWGSKGRAGWVRGAKEDLNRAVSSALTLSLSCSFSTWLPVLPKWTGQHSCPEMTEMFQRWMLMRNALCSSPAWVLLIRQMQ